MKFDDFLINIIEFALLLFTKLTVSLSLEILMYFHRIQQVEFIKNYQEVMKNI